MARLVAGRQLQSLCSSFSRNLLSSYKPDQTVHSQLQQTRYRQVRLCPCVAERQRPSTTRGKPAKRQSHRATDTVLKVPVAAEGVQAVHQLSTPNAHQAVQLSTLSRIESQGNSLEASERGLLQADLDAFLESNDLVEDPFLEPDLPRVGEEGKDANAPRVYPLYKIPQGILPNARLSKIKHAEFIKSSADVSQCPLDDKPEIAVIGRSNVGKSSLINMLTHRRELAQTSKKPGKTQLINHFLINGNWYLVDLPGYGYAKAPNAVREEWHGFTQKYFLSRPNLASVLLLVDASIPPLQVDLDCADWLGQNRIPLTVVFTKCDRKKKKKNGGRHPAENVAEFEQKLAEYYEDLPPWIMTSSVLSMGKDTLLGHVAQVINHWKS